jgi:RNA polymerase sigma-70 factor (ECF subfamily)
VASAAERVEESVVARIDIARALAALPEEYREAVVMHDLGGVPYEEIARLTGTPMGTVKSRISRGRRQLAGLLEHREVSRPSKNTTDTTPGGALS